MAFGIRDHVSMSFDPGYEANSTPGLSGPHRERGVFARSGTHAKVRVFGTDDVAPCTTAKGEHARRGSCTNDAELLARRHRRSQRRAAFLSLRTILRTAWERPPAKAGAGFGHVGEARSLLRTHLGLGAPGEEARLTEVCGPEAPVECADSRFRSKGERFRGLVAVQKKPGAASLQQCGRHEAC